MTQAITILGPNLGGGTESMHVHATGCADTNKRLYFNADGWKIPDATSIKEIVTDIYPPSDFDYPESDWQDYAGDIRFFPCVTLPKESE